MKEVIERLDRKGATLFKVSDKISDKTILQNDSNKSKAKKSIVDKIKKFYYLYMYEKVSSFGNDQEYKDVLNEYKEDLNNKIDSLNEEKQENIENNELEVANILENNEINLSTSKKIKSISEKSDDQVAKIDDKIEKANDKIKSIDEKLNDLDAKQMNENQVDEDIVNSEIEKTTQDIASSVTSSINDEQKDIVNENSVNNKIEENPQIINPKEESQEGKNINDSLSEIGNSVKFDVDCYINEAIEKTRSEVTSYYEDTVLKKYKDETMKMAKAARIQINNVTKQRDDARIEAEQYKSGYNSELEKNSQNEQEINDKNIKIENLTSENEMLKKQLEELTRQNEELSMSNRDLKVTVSTILRQGMVNDNIEQEQIEQEPIQKIR